MTDDNPGKKEPRKRNSGQFPAGTSGNPKGRPRGSKGLKTIIRNVSARKVHLSERGKRRTVTALEALIETLLAAALKGDRHARLDFLRYCERFAPEEMETLAKASLTEAEEEILATLLGRSQEPGEDSNER